jgi:hypothetical protein
MISKHLFRICCDRSGGDHQRKAVLHRHRTRCRPWPVGSDTSRLVPCNPRRHPARAPPHRRATRRSDARRPP